MVKQEQNNCKMAMITVKLPCRLEKLSKNGAMPMCPRLNQTGVVLSVRDIRSCIIDIEMCHHSPKHMTVV